MTFRVFDGIVSSQLEQYLNRIFVTLPHGFVERR
jgi:hypothetical protein